MGKSQQRMPELMTGQFWTIPALLLQALISPKQPPLSLRPVEQRLFIPGWKMSLIFLGSVPKSRLLWKLWKTWDLPTKEVGFPIYWSNMTVILERFWTFLPCQGLNSIRFCVKCYLHFKLFPGTYALLYLYVNLVCKEYIKFWTKSNSSQYF